MLSFAWLFRVLDVGFLMSILALSSTGSLVAHASEGVVDDQPVREFFGKYVQELDSSIFVWHWFNSSKRASSWQLITNADDSSGFAYFQDKSSLFFHNLCPMDKSVSPYDCDSSVDLRHGATQAFGPGLYASTDPVATADFGKGKNWVLMQIRLPKGFRYLNLKSISELAMPAEVASVLSSFDCNFSEAKSILSAGTMKIYQPMSDKCLLEIRKLLKDDLKIDGFSFYYPASDFKHCKDSNSAHQAAFVLTSGRTVLPEQVRIFNAKTVDDFKDRLRIQSLFYLAEISMQGTSKYMSFNAHPGYKYVRDDNDCKVTNGKFHDCRQVTEICAERDSDGAQKEKSCLKIPRPPEMNLVEIRMTKDSAPENKGVSVDNGRSTLLWPDLEGAAFDAQVASWIPNYMFGCQR